MTIGPNGIFTKAKNAKEEMQYSQELEALKLAVLDAKIEDVDASFEELIEVLKNDPKYTYIINNTKKLAEISDNGTVKVYGDITGNTIYVIPEKYEFGIDNKLNIIEPENRVANSNSSNNNQEQGGESQTQGEDRIVKILKEKEQYRIEAGEHDGHELVKAADLKSQTPGNATAEDILKNKTAWVDGEKITGTLEALTGSVGADGTISTGEFYYTAYIPTTSYQTFDVGFVPSKIFVVHRGGTAISSKIEMYSYDSNISTTQFTKCASNGSTNTRNNYTMEDDDLLRVIETTVYVKTWNATDYRNNGYLIAIK